MKIGVFERKLPCIKSSEHDHANMLLSYLA